MKILLIYPYFLEKRLQMEDVQTVPIGLYYIGAVLKQNGFDVEILNWFDINLRPDEIEATLREKKPAVIGFSIVHANRWGGIDIAGIARRILPQVKIVFGGVGTTFLWRHLLMHFREIDFAVLGEAEYSFLSLVQSIEKGNCEGIEQIKGIVFRKEGKIVKTEDAGVIQDLDELPMPSEYFAFNHISSSRGCPSNCTFCGSPQFWGRRVRFHSPEYFVGMIEQLYRKGVTFFFVSDDTFTMRKERVIRICRIIIEKGLKINWFAIARVNHVDEEMLCWMRKAGCIQISYGIESGSERIRKVLNKDIRTEDVSNAFSLTTRYGILARAYFIYGSPGENSKTIQETIDLICGIKPMSIIFYILDIFPGTALYEEWKRRNKLDDDIWLERVEDILYFETDPGLTGDMILAYGKKLRAAFYRNLPGFVQGIELINRQDLYECHADFLSRLAMTFTHGDYSAIDAIPEKDEIAQWLFEKSLEYYPNERAYLGLGIINQKKRKYGESIHILSAGIQQFPENEHIAVCLGISHMNLGQYEDALQYFLGFPESRQSLQYTAACYQAIGDSEKEAAVIHKMGMIRSQ